MRSPGPFDASEFDFSALDCWIDDKIEQMEMIAQPLDNFVRATRSSGTVDVKAYITLVMDALKEMVSWRTDVQTRSAPMYFTKVRWALEALGDVEWARIMDYELLGIGAVKPLSYPVRPQVTRTECLTQIQQHREEFREIYLTEPVSQQEDLSEVSFGLRSLPEHLIRYQLLRNGFVAGTFLSGEAAHRYARKIGWGAHTVLRLCALPECSRCQAHLAEHELIKAWYSFNEIVCAYCLPRVHIEAVARAIETLTTDAEVLKALSAVSDFLIEFDRDFSHMFALADALAERPAVYAIEFQLDDESKAIYVGQSRNVAKRLKDHVSTIVSCYYGDRRPLIESVMEPVWLRAEQIVKPVNRDVIADVLEAFHAKWPMVRHLRSSTTAQVSWQNKIATEVATRLGPRARLAVLEFCDDSEQLLSAEARWQKKVSAEAHCLPLWVANTERWL